MILGTCIAIIASGCSSLHGISFGGYMAARFFQGFGASPAATVGLSIINDLSFEHERGFRVGLWVLSIDLGTYAGVLSKSSPSSHCLQDFAPSLCRWLRFWTDFGPAHSQLADSLHWWISIGCNTTLSSSSPSF
jgi:MFS family permease